jgi:hypothetical protein
VNWFVAGAARRGISYEALVNRLLKDAMGARIGGTTNLRAEIRQLIREEVTRAS